MRDDEGRTGGTGGAANTPPFEAEPSVVRTAADHQITGGGVDASSRETESGREGRPADSALGGTGARVSARDRGQEAEGRDMGEPPEHQSTEHAAIAPNADTAPGGATRFTDRAQGRINDGMDRTADRIDDAAARLERLAQRAGAGEGRPRERAGEMAHATADTMESVARYLRDSDPQDLREDLERQVRRRPVQTVLIALAAGWIAGKILR